MFSGRDLLAIKHMRGKSTNKSRVRTAPKRKQQRRRNANRRPRIMSSRFRYRPGVPAAYRAGSLRNYFYTRPTRDGIIAYGRCFLKATTPSFENPATVWTYPVNPTYWSGTTLSVLASGYNSYRPLKLKICYEPTVGTDTAGLVVFGTVWNRITSSASTLINVLKESNGGFSTQPYRRMSRYISLGTHLSQNMFYTFGALNQSSVNPMQMILMYTGDKVPGEIWIEYTYKLSNMGMKASFDYTGSNVYTINANYKLEKDGVVPQAEDMAFIPSKTLVLGGITIGPGTILDYDYKKGQLSWNDTIIELNWVKDTLTITQLEGYLATCNAN